MPSYMFRCRSCGARDERFAFISEVDSLTVECGECSEAMVRDYRAEGVGFERVQHEFFSMSLGRVVRSQRDVDEAVKQIRDESAERLGYEPNLVVCHREEVGHATTDHRAEAAARFAHDHAAELNAVDSTIT